MHPDFWSSLWSCHHHHHHCLWPPLKHRPPTRALQGLTCDTGHWLLEGVSNPFLASLEDFIFCWLLLVPFPEFSVADGLRPLDPKDFSKAGVDECLYLFQCHSHGSPCFSSKQQHRFYCGAKDPYYDVDGQVWWGPNIRHLEKGYSCSANSHSPLYTGWKRKPVCKVRQMKVVMAKISKFNISMGKMHV